MMHHYASPWCCNTCLLYTSFGRPFLTSAHGHVQLPLIGDLELASAMVFDLGVYVVVVTVVLTVLAGLGSLSLRARSQIEEV